MKIFVAGHNGMVGSAIVRKLSREGDVELLLRSSSELDLRDENAVRTFMSDTKPDSVILAAAKVGGIHANNAYPADFIYDNLQIQNNVVKQAFEADVEDLLFLGSSCIYPRAAKQPMSEEALLTGILEPTNEPYAIAKIAGIKLCESFNRQYGTDYRSVMPTNLYGPGDNFHPENSHVIPALIRRFHDAKKEKAINVTVWGSGNPRREFLHVDDMASASLFVMGLEKEIFLKNTQPMLSHINVGYGSDVTIRELAIQIANVTGFEGAIDFDASKPDGTMQKLLDVNRLKQMGWEASISLKDGIQDTYDWYLDQTSEELRL